MSTAPFLVDIETRRPVDMLPERPAESFRAWLDDHPGVEIRTLVPAPPPAPPAKKVASWILTPPGDLADDNHAALAQITARCEELNATRALVREFADLLCHPRSTAAAPHGRASRVWLSATRGGGTESALAVGAVRA
jgi:hypothetical protein